MRHTVKGFFYIKKHTLFLLSSALCQSCIDGRRGVVVQWPGLNPNWSSARILFLKINSEISWWKCLSRTLLIIGSREMGLKDWTSFFFLSPFRIGTTFESFQSAGILPVLIDKLNSDVTEGAISSVNDLSIHALIPSGPADEWGFICLRSQGWKQQSAIGQNQLI